MRLDKFLRTFRKHLVEIDAYSNFRKTKMAEDIKKGRCPFYLGNIKSRLQEESNVIDLKLSKVKASLSFKDASDFYNRDPDEKSYRYKEFAKKMIAVLNEYWETHSGGRRRS